MLKTAGESSEQVLAVTLCDASAVIRAMFPCLMSVMQQPLDTLHLHNTQTRDTYRNCNSAPRRRHGPGRGSGTTGSRRRCRTPGTCRPGPAPGIIMELGATDIGEPGPGDWESEEPGGSDWEYRLPRLSYSCC